MLPPRSLPRRHAVPSSLERLEARIAPATLTVKNLHSSGPGSLHDLVEQANSSPGEDTIVFAKGLHGTIPFKELLFIEDDLQILGPEKGGITLDGRGRTSFFLVAGGPGDDEIDATFSHLKFTRGLDDLGGAIGIDDPAGTVTVTHCLFTGNRAIGGTEEQPGGATGAFGGAIFMNEGHLVVEQSRFSGNVAASPAGLDALGGAIYSYLGEVVVRSSTFTGNVAKAGDSLPSYSVDEPGSVGHAYGGAIFSGNSLTVEAGTVITKNQAIGGRGLAGVAGEKGAGLGAAGATGYVGGFGGGADGGGISSYGFLSLSGVSLSKNLAQGGNGGAGGRGGAGADGTKHRAEDDGFGGTSYATYAPGAGGTGGAGGWGGVALGGGVAHSGAVLIRDGTVVSGNVARAGHAGAGGATGANGRYVADRLAPAEIGEPPEGHATPGLPGRPGTGAGGGLWFANYDQEVTQATIRDSTFTGNVARGGNGQNGAAGYRGFDAASAEDGEDGYGGEFGGEGQAGVPGGAAYGGGLYLESPLSLLHSTVSYNSAFGGNGGKGGMGGAGGHGSNRGAGGEFRGEGGYGGSGGAGGDAGYASGGGISAEAAYLRVQDSSILWNAAVPGLAGAGGAIGQNGAPGAGVRDETIEDDPELLPVRGREGFRTSGGGGIAAASADLLQCTVAFNRAVDGIGGGLYLSALFGDSSTVHSSTITGNSAEFGGGLEIGLETSVHVLSTIAAGNKATAGADVSGSLEGGNNLFGQLDFLAEILTLDGFAEALTGEAGLGKLGLNGAAAGAPLTFALQAGSRAIGAGANPGETLADARGFARLQGGAYDIGATEFGQAPAPLPPEDI